MGDYKLEINEGIVLKNQNAFHPVGKKIGSMGELILTNLNIIYIKKGMLGGTKEVIKLPLNQIKIIDGNPQIRLERRTNGTTQMEIYFFNSEECFYFNDFGNKELIKWIDKIHEILTGEPAKIDEDDRNYVPGLSEVANTLKESIGTFKQAFGIKEKKQEKEKMATRCISCDAPLFGEKGATIKCKYCGVKQTIK